MQQDVLPHQDGPSGHQVHPGPATHRATCECQWCWWCWWCDALWVWTHDAAAAAAEQQVAVCQMPATGVEAVALCCLPQAVVGW